MSVLRVVLLVALIAICSANWKLYKKTYKKRYDGKEDVKRSAVFSANLKKINKHNLRYDLGLTTYRMGVNHLTDLTPDEYKKLLGFKSKASKAKHSKTHKTQEYKGKKEPPEAVDWRLYGYVTPVKDQGNCGSCWAFSAIGSLEGQHFAKNKKLVDLSAQNLVDCDTWNGGCQGGHTVIAYNYIINNKGIDSEATYPYKAVDSECHYDANGIGANMSSYVNLPRGDELALKNAVATVGPIAVAIDAGHDSFHSYKEGIYDDPDCTPRHNHAVLVVGYGTENGKDFWLVKNSWSTRWGDKGYIKMSRNKDNQCGIAGFPIYPVI